MIRSTCPGEPPAVPSAFETLVPLVAQLGETISAPFAVANFTGVVGVKVVPSPCCAENVTELSLGVRDCQSKRPHTVSVSGVQFDV